MNYKFDTSGPISISTIYHYAALREGWKEGRKEGLKEGR